MVIADKPFDVRVCGKGAYFFRMVGKRRYPYLTVVIFRDKLAYLGFDLVMLRVDDRITKAMPAAVFLRGRTHRLI